MQRNYEYLIRHVVDYNNWKPFQTELKLYQQAIIYHHVNGYTHLHPDERHPADWEGRERPQLLPDQTSLHWTVLYLASKFSQHNVQLFNSRPTQCLEGYRIRITKYDQVCVNQSHVHIMSLWVLLWQFISAQCKKSLVCCTKWFYSIITLCSWLVSWKGAHGWSILHQRK